MEDEKRKRLLIVEGPNDKHVLYALLKRHPRRIPEVFTIKEKEGVDRLLESVPAELKGSELERLGVLVDADVSLEQRWAQLRDRVRELPKEPNSNGTVVVLDSGIRFGAWVMPNNQIPGRLEDFLAFLLPADCDYIGRVDALLEALPRRDYQDSPAWRPKARIHSWLALQRDPGRPLGQAITAQFLIDERPCVDALMDWLHLLFVAE